MKTAQRFVADQRYDLPQYESMIAFISAEFNSYNKTFFMAENKIVKNWVLNNAGGLTVQVDQSTDSSLFNTSRVGKEEFIARLSTDMLLSLNLADNATNYVEVQIYSTTCAPDTVAIWDTTANGGLGQEFTQTVNINSVEAPQLVSNTIAFTGDPDKLPLAIVTTSGGVITGIADARNMMFNLVTPWNFGVTRTDKTIGSIKNMYDALASSILELKGSVGNWYDKPYSSIKLLREYQNMFISGGGAIQWEGPAGANNIYWPNSMFISIAGRPSIYTIATSTQAIPDGYCVYVDIPEGVPGGNLTPVVAQLSAVPVNSTNQRIMVLFYRKGSTIFGMMDIPELDSGEQAFIGQDLPVYIRTRLGILGENLYEAYTSTTNIIATDSYAVAISKLDAMIGSITNNLPKEETVIVGAGGVSGYVSGTLTWLTSSAVPDLNVFINGRRLQMSATGVPGDEDYYKVSANTIAFNYLIPQFARITVRREHPGGGGGGGGVDLTNVIVDPQPDVNGARAIGTVSKAWKSFFVKDKSNAQVYEIEIVSGVLQVTPRP